MLPLASWRPRQGTSQREPAAAAELEHPLPSDASRLLGEELRQHLGETKTQEEADEAIRVWEEEMSRRTRRGKEEEEENQKL